MKEDNINQLGDHDAPFCEQQYMHGSCHISLFKFKSFDQFNTPKLPQILDIYSVMALQKVGRASSQKKPATASWGSQGGHSITKHTGGWLEGLNQKPQTIYPKIAILKKC